MSNMRQPIKSRLQNEILTASITQEIEEDGNNNRRQKGGHDETCVSCLEDDNECMVPVYMFFIVALSRPL